MASGRPSSDAAHLLDDRGRVVVEHELPAQLRARAGEQRRPSSPGAAGSSVVHELLRPDRAAPGWSPARAAGEPRRAARPTSSAALVDDVLAVVEHQHRLGAGEPLAQHRLAAGDVQGLGDDRPGQPTRGVDAVEPHQPDPPGGLTPRGQLEREPGLADAGRPDHGHQPVLADEAGQGGRVVRAADQRR